MARRRPTIVAAWARHFALTFGAPGLFLLASLDTSFVSLPGVVDLLLVLMVIEHKGRLVWFAGGATLGSVAGCLVLFWLARAGGEALLARRLGRMRSGRVDRILGMVRRHGALAVIVPSLLPPPMPFKLFVLLAGLAGISPAAFASAIAIGRGLRFFTEGLLAVWYGDQALALIQAHSVAASLVAIALIGVGGAGWLLWTRRKRPPLPLMM